MANVIGFYAGIMPRYFGLLAIEIIMHNTTIMVLAPCPLIITITLHRDPSISFGTCVETGRHLVCELDKCEDATLGIVLYTRFVIYSKSNHPFRLESNISINESFFTW